MSPRARLTREHVAEMRRRVAGGATIQSAATWAGCGWTTAYKAVTGLSWRSVDNPPPVRARTGRWSDDEIVYLASHSDDPAVEIATVLGRSRNAVTIKRHREEL